MDKHSTPKICLVLLISVFWAITRCNCTSLSCLKEERLALLKFKNDLNGGGSEIFASWKDGSNCCEWDGVVCGNETSHVVQLHLSNFSKIRWPSDTVSPLFSLKQLQHLDLSFNGFTGSIPAGISSLQELRHLDFSNNHFQGKLPEQLGSLSHLQYLNLSLPYEEAFACYSSLEWTSNLRALQNLSLKWVNLSSTGQTWAASISHLRDLHSLDMSNCMLSGPISPLLLNLTELQIMDLHTNNFFSPLPSWIGNMTSLVKLDLYQSDISGPFPLSLSRLPRLEYLLISGTDSFSGNITEILGSGWPRIIMFSLLGSNLTGTIPFSVGNLTTLKHFRLADTKIEGYIPSSLANLTLQKLVLRNNSFKGEIPGGLSTTLERLDLSSNDFTGIVPNSLWELRPVSYLNLSYNKLEGNLPSSLDIGKYIYLDLRNNKFNGTLPIPLVPSQSLKGLDLSHNDFNGVIPEDICSLLPNIEVLSLSYTHLSGLIPPSITSCSGLLRLKLENTGMEGQIPSTIGKLKRLKSLHLNANKLEGIIPWSLQDCSDLEILDVGHNHLSGTIPIWITKFSELSILVFRSNLFQGHIPPEVGNLPKLRVLDLAHNNLNGFIPPELGKLSGMVQVRGEIPDSYNETAPFFKEEINITTKEMEMSYSNSILLLITSIDLSGNQLSGTIPPELGGLKDLVTLNLSRNSLSGEIPSSFGMLQKIESMDLSHNKLEGMIPLEMLNNSFMAVFIVSNNMLCGEIPPGQQFSTFNASFFSENSCLCGFPLERRCRTTLERASVDGNEEEERSMEWYWYTCWMASFAIGVGAVFGPVKFSRRWRKRYWEAMDGGVVWLDHALGGE